MHSWNFKTVVARYLTSLIQFTDEAIHIGVGTQHGTCSSFESEKYCILIFFFFLGGEREGGL